MAELDANIEFYSSLRQDLEKNSMNKWVLIRDSQLIGVFDSSEQAAIEATNKFGSGPYLIRQVGAPPINLPVSVVTYGGN